MLGYVFLTLSTLAAAFTFQGKGRERIIRILLLIHGAFAVPTFIFPMIPTNTNQAVESANLGGVFALVVWCALFAVKSILSKE
jgi:cytochrome c oxidase subunit IV